MNDLTFNVSLQAGVGGVHNNSTPLSPARYGDSFQINDGLTFGTGVRKGNQLYVSVFTMAASATTTLTISAGLTNQVNESAGFSRIKAVIVQLIPNADGSNPSNQITVGNAGTHPFGGFLGAAANTFTVYLGGFAAFCVGPGTATLPSAYTPTDNAIAVGSGSADQIKFTNNDGSNVATVRLILVGEA